MSGCHCHHYTVRAGDSAGPRAAHLFVDSGTRMDIRSSRRVTALVEQISPDRRTIFRGLVHPVDAERGVVPAPGLAEAIAEASPGDEFAVEYEIAWSDDLHEIVPNRPERIVAV